MIAYMAIGIMLAMVIPTALGWIPHATFNNLWQWWFVAAVKSAVFAMIPFGFLFGILTWGD